MQFRLRFPFSVRASSSHLCDQPRPRVCRPRRSLPKAPPATRASKGVDVGKPWMLDLRSLSPGVTRVASAFPRPRPPSQRHFREQGTPLETLVQFSVFSHQRSPTLAPVCTPVLCAKPPTIASILFFFSVPIGCM